MIFNKKKLSIDELKKELEKEKELERKDKERKKLTKELYELKFKRSGLGKISNYLGGFK